MANLAADPYSFSQDKTKFLFEQRMAMSFMKPSNSHVLITGFDSVGNQTWEAKEWDGAKVEVSRDATVTIPPRAGRKGETRSYSVFQTNSFAARVTFADGYKVVMALPMNARQKEPEEWLERIVEEANRLLCLGETAGIIEDD